MLLMIDNYDSFTYNLVHYFEQLAEKMVIFRNDALTLSDIEAINPGGIVLSPGPCTPNESGICLPVMAAFSEKYPILGICLGHQIIAQHFGAKIIKAPEPVHGKVFAMHHDGKGIFTGLPSPFQVTRYHSLMIDPMSLPECLEVTAKTEDGIIMGVRHRTLPIEGVQFHPEAILTQYGLELLSNFLKVSR